MTFNKETFRWELVLGKGRLGKPIDYHFTVRTAEGLERDFPLAGPELPLRIPAPSRLVLNEVLPRPRRELRAPQQQRDH